MWNIWVKINNFIKLIQGSVLMVKDKVNLYLAAIEQNQI
jgi:hypothetical protein